jgi:hypothetical protein
MVRRKRGRPKGSLSADAAVRQHKVIVEWQKTGLSIDEYAKLEAEGDPGKAATIAKRVRRAVAAWFGPDKRNT